MITILSLITITLIYLLYRAYKKINKLQKQSDEQFQSILDLSKEIRKDYPKMSHYAWEIRKRRVNQALNRK